MTEVGLVTEISMNQETSFQPGRSIEQLTIQQTLDIYEKRGEAHFSQTLSEEEKIISRYLKEIADTIEKSPANAKLKDI